MLKQFLTAVVTLSVALPVLAQNSKNMKKSGQTSAPLESVVERPKSGVRLIPVLGLSSFKLKYSGTEADGEANDLVDANLGVVAGGIAEFQTGPIVTGVGLVYQQTGMEFSMGDEFDSFKMVANFSYLAVPAYAKYYFADDGKTRIYGRGGLQVGVLTRAKGEATETHFDGFDTVTKKEEEDLSKEVRKVEVLIQPALGMEFELSDRTSLLVDVSFNYGLTRMNYDNDEKIRSQGFNFISGLAIDL